MKNALKLIAALVIGILVGAIGVFFTFIELYKEEVDQTETTRESVQEDYYNKRTEVVDLDEEVRNLKWDLKTLQTKYDNLKETTATLIELIPEDKALIPFSNEELGLAFKYPAWYGELSFTLRNGEEAGKIFRGSFPNVPIEFGGITKGFREGRGGWITDYSGGELYAEENEILKTISIGGREITIYQGETNTGDRYPMGDPLSEGNFAATSALTGDEFKGVIFFVNNTYGKDINEGYALEEFESFLERIKRY